MGKYDARNEALRRSWNSAKREAYSRSATERTEEELRRQGMLPDEHEIYNVLCPAIRETWSPMEERQRRVVQPVRATIPEVGSSCRVSRGSTES